MKVRQDGVNGLDPTNGFANKRVLVTSARYVFLVDSANLAENNC